MSILFPQTWIPLNPVRWFTFLKIRNQSCNEALDWLCDRSNLDPKIQMKCIDTKHQMKFSVNLSNLQEESSSCQWITTLYGERRKRRLVFCEFQNRSRVCKKIGARTLVVFFGPGSEKKWYGTHTYKPNGEWDRVAGYMMINFSEKRTPPYSVGPVLWNEEIWKSKGNAKLCFHFCGDDATVEVFLRTVIPVNQLSVYGAVADLCDELAWRISGCSECTGKPVAQNNLETMVKPTELSTTNQPPRTNETVQGNLLHYYERKFANLPDHRQLIKRCSNVGNTKTVAKGQYFTTIQDAELAKWGGSCREYTSHRYDQLSQVKGWIRGSPVTIKVVTESRSWSTPEFGDGTCSWVMIVNGIPREPHRWHWRQYKRVAKARPKQTMPTTSCPTVTLPYQQREWTDVEPSQHHKSCIEVSKKMIRLLRHDPSVLREEDGAVEFRISAQMFHSEFQSAQHWFIRTWLN